jgi:hypothetical protein
MAHPRKLIRKAVVTALRDARTAAGSRVFEHPRNDRKEFPALVVEDFGAKHSEGQPTEVQRVLSDFDGDLERGYRFVVIAEIQSTGAPQDERDDLIAEVEAAVAEALADGALPGVKAVTPMGYTADDSDDSDRPIRRGIQVFEAIYITSGSDPATTL